MPSPQENRLFRKKRVRPYVGHGSVYAWLRAYHHEVAGALARQEQSWASLVADMALDGLTGRRGKCLTANAALRVWQRVCRDVEAEAISLPPKRISPSRMSPDWRPTVVPPPPIRTAPAPLAGTSPPASSDPRAPSRDPDMTPEGQAVLDKAWEALLAADRKKFGF